MRGVIAHVQFEGFHLDADWDGADFGLLGGVRIKRKAEVLQAKGTIGEPSVFGHFDDQLDFGLADRLLVFDELVEESVELFLLFDVFKDAEFGAEAVFGAVLGDFSPGLNGFGATGFLCVAAIGRDLFGGCYMSNPEIEIESL
ncbi:MAG TPA: hypothetical protein VF283_11350 [Bryobacteraceae bacterium]